MSNQAQARRGAEGEREEQREREASELPLNMKLHAGSSQDPEIMT